MSDFLKQIQSEVNEDASFLSDSDISNIKEYISTGSRSLNIITSGDMDLGIPDGKVTGFIGKSGTGKSYIVGKICAKAQEKGYDVVWFDAENATDKPTLERHGCDTSKLIVIPPSDKFASIEDFMNSVVSIVKLFEARKKKEKDAKLLIVLDSLGNLPPAKELKDADEGHNASDMGLRAKVIRKVARVITKPLAVNHIPMIVINHTYTAPQKFGPALEVPVGGDGIIYLSHIIVSLGKSLLKEDEDNEKQVTGNILKALTVKNRLVPEKQRAELKLDFRTGLDEYYGLLPYAERFGFITKTDTKGTKYTVNHLNKIFFEKYLYIPEVWDPILEELNKKIKEFNTFSSVSDELLKDKNEDNQKNDEVVVEGDQTEKVTEKKKKVKK